MRSGILGIRNGVAALALLLGQADRLQATTANDLCAAAADPCVVRTAVTVTDGSVIDVGMRELRIVAGGALDVFSGAMTLRAGRLDVQANGFVRAAGTPSVTGGSITVEATDVSIGGTVSANGAPGGNITMTIANALTVTGMVTANNAIRTEIGGNIAIVAGSATIAGPVQTLGGADAVGGDITIDTLGAMTVSAAVDASGGDGGSVELEAGVLMNAGTLVLTETSMVRADATLAGGFGGTVDVTANGPEGSGNLTANGVLSAIGRTGGEEIGGGSGGCVSVTAEGDLRVARAGARLSVEGGGPDGDGGEIEMTTTRGLIDMQGVATASAPGPESNGGAVSIDAGGEITVSGSMLSTGGDGGGGELSAISNRGSTRVGQTAVLDATASSGGSGGSICLESGTASEGAQLVAVEGRLLADGGSSGGAGGTIELAGTDSVRLSSTGTMRAAGALGGGTGGTVSVFTSPGSAFIEGPIVVGGGSPSGLGGIISIEAGSPDAAGRIAVNGSLDARGFGDGGEVGLAASGGVDVRNTILASSSSAVGGLVQIVSQGMVSVGATVSVDGSVAPAPGNVLAGLIEIVGCTVTVCAVDAPACPGSGAGTLSALGPNGINQITGRDITVVLGRMRAHASSGRNELIYDGTLDREPLVVGQVTPAARLIVDGSVQPCPSCGNMVVEAPETCDDGNELDGDGCSADCQIEDPIPGDANGDFILSPDDLGFIATEIFDGDGDSITMVSAGAFPGGPGADANGDGRVTAADLPATARLLVP